MDSAQLEALSKRLLAYVRRRAGAHGRSVGKKDALAKGEASEDIAATAIESLFGGDRQWNPAKEPDAWAHVVSVANSLLSNLWSSADRRLRSDEPGDEPADPDESSEVCTWLRERRERAYSLLADAAGADAQLSGLHDLILYEGIHKPIELAKRLAVSVSVVNNLKKRFWRACRQALIILDGEDDAS